MSMHWLGWQVLIVGVFVCITVQLLQKETSRMGFFVYLIVGVICGFITKSMNESKGYEQKCTNSMKPRCFTMWIRTSAGQIRL